MWKVAYVNHHILRRNITASAQWLEKLNLRLELGSVIGSDLFKHDEYIKSYLQDPEIPLITRIKIGLRYYVTADLILQLDDFKDHLQIDSFKDLKKWYTKRTERSPW